MAGSKPAALPLGEPPTDFGGMTETRTQKPAFADRRISNPLQYHYGTIPIIEFVSLRHFYRRFIQDLPAA